MWAARLAWLAVAVFGGAGFGAALAGRSREVQITGTVGMWVVWGLVALALLVPSTVSLTFVRSAVPAAMVAAAMAVVEGVPAVDAVVLLGVTVLTGAFVASGELGEAFVQASAYGSERRFLLRPPAAQLLPMAVSWIVLSASALAAPLLLAARNWVLGVPVAAIAGFLGAYLGRRFHRLSRRWLVLVPVGVVVHDHVVLAETALLQTPQITRLGLALSGTEAADLTGPAAGMVVELTFDGAPTVVLAGSSAKPGGTALHVRSALVAPSRPGRFLRAAAAQGLPVG